jgi:hypothetical protein
LELADRGAENQKTIIFASIACDMGRVFWKMRLFGPDDCVHMYTDVPYAHQQNRWRRSFAAASKRKYSCRIELYQAAYPPLLKFRLLQFQSVRRSAWLSRLRFTLAREKNKKNSYSCLTNFPSEGTHEQDYTHGQWEKQGSRGGWHVKASFVIE